MVRPNPLRRNRRTIRDHGPEDTDIQIGHRIRLRRTLLGLSQENLADRLGIGFQQLQKNETGATRVSASRLWYLSAALAVSPDYFFQTSAQDPVDAASAAGDGIGDETMKSRETLELVRAFNQIDNPDARRICIALTLTVATGHK